MRVLIGCEFSGVMRRAFRERGHDAWSCDLLPAEDGSPYHLQMDVELAVLFYQWDLAVFHPPCTRLCNSGVSWLERRNLWAEMREAAAFFKRLLDAPIPKIAVENPVMHHYAVDIIGRKQDQTVQPHQHGHPHSKRTGWWLVNLPRLKPTKVLALPASGHWENQTPSGQNKLGPSATRWMERSRTYDGIALAAATQWG